MLTKKYKILVYQKPNKTSYKTSNKLTQLMTKSICYIKGKRSLQNKQRAQ